MASEVPSHWGACIPNYRSVKMLDQDSKSINPLLPNLRTESFTKLVPLLHPNADLGGALPEIEDIHFSKTIEKLEKQKIAYLLSDEIKFKPKYVIKLFKSQKEKDRWEKRLVKGAEKIERKLKEQYDAAQKQMKNERAHSLFSYQPGKRLNNLEHFFWESADLGIDVNFEIGVSFSINVGHKHPLEDRYHVSSFSLQIGSTSYPAQLFGVFDGHGGGAEAAIYARDNLPRLLERELKKQNPETLSGEGIWNALNIAFVETSRKIKGKSGTTATVILIINDRIWIPNAGDSRAILVSEGEVIRLSEDADPADPRHAASCQKRGGVIVDGRLISKTGATLAMTKSLGDAPYQPAVSPRPENIAHPLSIVPRGSHIILATDGLWSVASSRQVAKAVSENSEESSLELTQNLLTSARRAKSKDDITIIVIKFA
ncbi:MAG: protein phosphatase 2C family protein [Chlamydiae bacterium]|nr:protein phosphatase 2C family protein [Chlamydiota bacterium]